MTPDSLDTTFTQALEPLMPLLHRALAWRLATTREDPRELVIVMRDDGLYFAPRGALAPHLDPLQNAPEPGHIWLLVIRGGEDHPLGLVRQVAIDLSQLTVKRPMTLPQEQLLDALIVAAAPQLQATMASYRRQGGIEQLAAFLHDNGPGIIEREKLQSILLSHGYFSDAETLMTPPREGHMWVWISTWEAGGTVGLRQLCIDEPIERPEPGCMN